MKLWLDDSRKPPWGYDKWAKTAAEAIEILEGGEVDHVSLDHDLIEAHYAVAFASVQSDRAGYSQADDTGFAVLRWMALTGKWVASIAIHTANEAAGDAMELYIVRYAPEKVVRVRIRVA